LSKHGPLFLKTDENVLRQAQDERSLFEVSQ